MNNEYKAKLTKKRTHHVDVNPIVGFDLLFQLVKTLPNKVNSKFLSLFSEPVLLF